MKRSVLAVMSLVLPEQYHLGSERNASSPSSTTQVLTIGHEHRTVLVPAADAIRRRSIPSHPATANSRESDFR